MSELYHIDKARLKADYPGLYIVALNFDDMVTLRQLEDLLSRMAMYSSGEENRKFRNERDLVKQMIKDAES